MNSFLLRSIHELPGIGAAKAELMNAELGVKSIFDFFQVYPYRYIDRTVVSPLYGDFQDGDFVQFRGKLGLLKTIGIGYSKRLTAKLLGSDGSVELIWFKGIQILEKTLKPGADYLVFGKINKFKGQINLPHPEMEVESDRTNTFEQHFFPVYPNTEKLTKRGLDSKNRRKILADLLMRLTDKDLPEFLPKSIIQDFGLISFAKALREIHFPRSNEDIKQAKRRLKFEELFFMQLGLLRNNLENRKRIKGYVFEKVGKQFNEFYQNHLPFNLTNAQKRVLKEIRSNLGSGSHMNRLLQGDVGSGKTIIAFFAMLIAVDNGFQSCLIAPTEILVGQHYVSIKKYTEQLGLSAELLTGNVKGKKRASILQRLSDGDIDILIGTHAVFEDNVIFKNLGLSITDEQHRFGVAQRAKLWEKSKPMPPHVLVMTATPIPRTLAMTLYGDLDVSVIDELPPGRKEIKTEVKYEGHRTEVLRFMKDQIDQGRQIYVVYPLIEESEKFDLEDLQRGYDFLFDYFKPPRYQISMVHGRMKPDDKEFAMQRFVSGETQIMVATTVIEVGVNVPNASVMIIENAERFGLSAMHQLRGRVGRGADQSYCILMSSFKRSKESKERLEIMVKTSNGFEIAEADLKLRGPGALDGLKQSGLPELKIANLSEDTPILTAARESARQILIDDPNFSNENNQPLKDYFSFFKEKSKWWGRVS